MSVIFPYKTRNILNIVLSCSRTSSFWSLLLLLFYSNMKSNLLYASFDINIIVSITKFHYIFSLNLQILKKKGWFLPFVMSTLVERDLLSGWLSWCCYYIYNWLDLLSTLHSISVNGPEGSKITHTTVRLRVLSNEVS